MNTSVAEFLLNTASYLRRVMDGEQICLINEGRVQARITPERQASSEPSVQEKIEMARRLKTKLSAKYADDDWSARDYLEAGRRA